MSHRINRVPYSLLSLLAVLGLLTATNARAQGFGIYEQSTCTMGRAETGVAQPCEDGSAIFYNPAGLARSSGLTISAGATVIAASGKFTADGTHLTSDLKNDPIAAPHLYAVYGINDRLAVGLGAYVPYGLGTKWSTDFEGCYMGYDNNLQSIYIQPTVAYQLTDNIALGGGLTVAIGSVEINQMLDLSTQPVPSPAVPAGTTFGQLGIPNHTAFADVNLDASGATGVGANFGLQVKVTDWLGFGAKYMMPVSLDYKGTATFSPYATGIALPEGNPFGVPAGTPIDAVLEASGLFSANGLLADQDVKTTIEMPAQFVAGVSVQAVDRLLLLVDYQWTRWSSFDEIALNFANPLLNNVRYERYENTNAIRLGAEYALTNTLTMRAGYLFNQAAAPAQTVTPLLPEGNRDHVTAGLSWQATPNVAVHVAYQYLGQQDRRGRVTDAAPGVEPTTALNSGLYSFNAHLFGTTLTLHF